MDENRGSIDESVGSIFEMLEGSRRIYNRGSSFIVARGQRIPTVELTHRGSVTPSGILGRGGRCVKCDCLGCDVLFLGQFA